MRWLLALLFGFGGLCLGFPLLGAAGFLGLGFLAIMEPSRQRAAVAGASVDADEALKTVHDQVMSADREVGESEKVDAKNIAQAKIILMSTRLKATGKRADLSQIDRRDTQMWLSNLAPAECKALLEAGAATALLLAQHGPKAVHVAGVPEWHVDGGALAKPAAAPAAASKAVVDPKEGLDANEQVRRACAW